MLNLTENKSSQCFQQRELLAHRCVVFSTSLKSTKKNTSTEIYGIVIKQKMWNYKFR